MILALMPVSRNLRSNETIIEKPDMIRCVAGQYITEVAFLFIASEY
jgi:hypothetical protein